MTGTYRQEKRDSSIMNYVYEGNEVRDDTTEDTQSGLGVWVWVERTGLVRRESLTGGTVLI